jgi:4-amino-4-deoxy-L-arabinose transferase-like glycosyltransferase
MPPIPARLPAVLAALIALAASFGIARVHDPPGIFDKYALVAAAGDSARVDDVSPLYLALTRLLLPAGMGGVLLAQAAAHAATAALVALSVQRLAGPRAALLAGILAALHAPLLVAAGTHEPEAFLQLALAAAIAAGVAARDRRREAEAAQGSVRGAAMLALLAGACLGAAALLRPQQILLVPAWALWMALGARRRAVAIAPLLGAALVLAPFVVPRLVAGLPPTMNPGVVLYEGNWPAASGLARVAPPLVRELELRHPEEPDYGHVAYRRLASFALGREATPRESNAWWLSLMREGLSSEPQAALRREGRKLVHAFAPHEVHDLLSMEDLSRRTRAVLPWGFFVLACGLAWIPLARAPRLASLLGPLCVGALAVAIQLAFYASARQRLPLSVALLVIVPVLLSDLHAGALRPGIRRSVALAMGPALALALAWGGGLVALVDHAQWDLAGARPARSFGESVAAIADGRLLRAPGERKRALALVAGVEAVRRGGEAPRELHALAGRRLDLTIDDASVLVPEAALARRARTLNEGAELSEEALSIRPGDPRVRAQAIAAKGGVPASEAMELRPPGCDPASWLWLLSRETGDARLAEPLRASFPDLF